MTESKRSKNRRDRLGVHEAPILEIVFVTLIEYSSVVTNDIQEHTSNCRNKRLSLKKMEHLKKAREQHGFVYRWTLDGKIMFKRNGDKPKVCYS